jgi:hypothetical protein
VVRHFDATFGRRFPKSFSNDTRNTDRGTHLSEVGDDLARREEGSFVAALLRMTTKRRRPVKLVPTDRLLPVKSALVISLAAEALKMDRFHHKYSWIVQMRGFY